MSNSIQSSTEPPLENAFSTAEAGDSLRDIGNHCRDLQTENALLKQQLDRVIGERDQLKKAILSLTWEDVPFDEDQLLSQSPTHSSLKELIAALEKQVSC